MTDKEQSKNLAKSSLNRDFFESQEMASFQEFMGNTMEQKNQLSNTIDIWDALPKYAPPPSDNELEGERPALIERSVVHRKIEYIIRITPATISTQKGKETVFPGANEELVEDALRKLAAQESYGFYSNTDRISGVAFTITALRTELKRRGHSRGFAEIIRSLMILAGSSVEIIRGDGAGFTKSSYLPCLTAVSRSRWLEDPDSKWVAQFHPLVTQSISSITYRQFNYAMMMSLKTHLARWLHTNLSHNYLNASIICPHVVMQSAIQKNSGLVNVKQTAGAVRKVVKSLDELVSGEILTEYKKEYILGNKGKILDVQYTLTPHPKFIGEIKAANKRHSNLLEGEADPSDWTGNRTR